MAYVVESLPRLELASDDVTVSVSFHTLLYFFESTGMEFIYIVKHTYSLVKRSHPYIFESSGACCPSA